jgi:hypothetical protein
MAMALCDLATVVRLEGDLRRARAMYDDSVRRSLHVGDRRGAGLALLGLGWIALDTAGNIAEAYQRFGGALDLFQEIGDRRGVALALEGLACAAAARAEGWLAARLLGAADGERLELGAPRPPRDADNLQRRLASARRAMGDRVWLAEWRAAHTLNPLVAAAESGVRLGAAPVEAGAG